MGYPNEPGYTEGGTSKEAADRMKVPAATWRERILDVFRNAHEPLTADEACHLLGMTDKQVVATGRPRVTELYKQGKIIRSGRKLQDSGFEAYAYVPLTTQPGLL